MIHRKFSPAVIESQEKLRNQFLSVIRDFTITNAAQQLAKEEALQAIIDELLDKVNNSSDEVFFKNYKVIIETIFHLIKWVDKSYKGVIGAEANLTAAKLNAGLIDLENYNYTKEFKEKINDFVKQVTQTGEVNQINSIFLNVSLIPFSYLFGIEYDEYAHLKRQSSVDDDCQEEEPVIVIAIDFLIGNEPWANPQILKPQVLYSIEGNLQVSKWPKGYDKLILRPISAQNNTLYDVIIPEIGRSDADIIDITGQVFFKYPQHSFDESFAIKLLAYFQNQHGEKVYAVIIGYNQLIAKVLDPNSSFFLAGFTGMNEIVLNIYVTLQKECPLLNEGEKNDFLKLLSGILNYQGYSLQSGIYKNIDSIPEDTFRDNMIQHLTGLNYLGAEIVKESHLSGGRIEIAYKGLIAELKVEKTISDREQLIKKYGNQPVAYSSGNAKQLSILCILDLTEKILPPATPQNNVRLITPTVHGFQDSALSYPSKQVVVIIDGNNKNPSEYSR